MLSSALHAKTVKATLRKLRFAWFCLSKNKATLCMVLLKQKQSYAEHASVVLLKQNQAKTSQAK
jgi:hypothetical protein